MTRFRRHRRAARPGRPHRYADGRRYRAPAPALAMAAGGGRYAFPAFDVWARGATWPDFWGAVRDELRRAGFARGTLRVYRQVLRSFRTFAQGREAGLAPRGVDTGTCEDYIKALAVRGVSRSWQSVNTSVLRTAFDKLGGKTVTRRLVTPGRREPLPVVLTVEEAGRLVRAADSVRDRLLIGLLYGCGLKVGELCRLRWMDIALEQDRLLVRHACGRGVRAVALPGSVRAVLELGVRSCSREAYVFPGASEGRHLTPRMAERIVARAAAAAGLHKPVCCMTLRHSYAVESLRGGASFREVQEALGHARVETTLRYRGCFPGGIIPGLAPSQPSPPPDAVVFPAEALPDLAPEGLVLPFEPEPARPGALAALLRTRLAGRFLALRRYACRSP